MTLDDARRALTDTNERIAAVNQQRTKLLIAGDNAALDRNEIELDALRRYGARMADRIAALEAQAAEAQADAVAKRRKELRERFAKKLADADAAAAKLQDTIALADEQFREVIRLREDARAGFPLGDSHVNAVALTADGCAMSGIAVKTLLQHELYRIGAHPLLGGSSGQIKRIDFPGGHCPRIEWALTPQKITPFADALKRASAYAVELMNSRLDPLAAALPAEDHPPAAAEAPAPSIAPETAAAPVDNAESQMPQAPQNHPSQDRKNALLARMNVLSMDISPEGEAAYMAVVAEIAALEAETGASQS